MRGLWGGVGGEGSLLMRAVLRGRGWGVGRGWEVWLGCEWGLGGREGGGGLCVGGGVGW